MMAYFWLFFNYFILIYLIFLLKHDVVTFPISRISLAHSLAFIAFIFWILQIVSGFMLLGILAFSLEIQYAELISITFHGNFVWLLRLLHMLGANFVVFATFLHAGKSISFAKVVNPLKAIIWLLGSVIFLLSLGVAFSGYVVVSGNMSYWAALVILNLASVIPFFGDEIVAGILASSTVTSWAIRRFTVLHFLLGVVAIITVLLHIICLHRQNPSGNQVEIADGAENLLIVLAKDASLFMICFLFLFFESTKSLVHPDNWQGFSRLLTPAHIEPEVYFLWTFAIIKLHNGKILGFVRRESGAIVSVGITFVTVFALQLLTQLSAIFLEIASTFLKLNLLFFPTYGYHLSNYFNRFNL
jgi:ubiquinol-cytochrome c reductase cytochrome b subunit